MPGVAGDHAVAHRGRLAERKRTEFVVQADLALVEELVNGQHRLGPPAIGPEEHVAPRLPAAERVRPMQHRAGPQHERTVGGRTELVGFRIASGALRQRLGFFPGCFIGLNGQGRRILSNGRGVAEREQQQHRRGRMADQFMQRHAQLLRSANVQHLASSEDFEKPRRHEDTKRILTTGRPPRHRTFSITTAARRRAGARGGYSGLRPLRR
jgi:hypothetical protein